MPVERTAGLINDLYRLPISTGTVMSMINETAEVLAPTVGCIATGITKSAAAGADETKMRVAGKLHWLHTLATSISTWMGVHARRGREAIEEFDHIPHFKGILGHDGWKPYRITQRINIRCVMPIMCVSSGQSARPARRPGHSR